MPNERIGSTSNPTEIRVSTFEKSLGIISFKIPDNPLQTGQARQKMPEEFEEETEYFEIKATKDKVSALKTYGGQEIKKLARNLPDTAPVDDDDYKKLIRKRNNHFLPKKNTQ